MQFLPTQPTQMEGVRPPEVDVTLDVLTVDVALPEEEEVTSLNVNSPVQPK